jgi:hypothetical protein
MYDDDKHGCLFVLEEATHWWHFLLNCSLGSAGVEGAESGEKRKELVLED